MSIVPSDTNASDQMISSKYDEPNAESSVNTSDQEDSNKHAEQNPSNSTDTSEQVDRYEHDEPNRAGNQRRNRSTIRAVVVFNIILILILLAVLYLLIGGLSNNTSTDSTTILPQSQVISSGAMVTPASRIDLAGLVQPLIMIALGWVVGFLGLKRLSQYDDEINRIRESIERQSNNFHGEINRKIESIRSDVDVLANSSITKQIRERTIELDEQQERIEKEAQARIAEIEFKLKPYAWLEHRREDDAELIKTIPSVGFALKEVEKLCQDDKIEKAIPIGQKVISDKVRGNSNDYYALATLFATHASYPLAFDIVKLGLEFYHNDIDLLAVGLTYSSMFGDFAACVEILNRLLAIDKKYWTAISFDYLGDYYKDNRDYDKAIELMDEFINCFPFDERGYLTIGSIHEGKGDLLKARKIYEECTQKVQRTPRVSFNLAKIYIAMGEYQNAIKAIDKAIECNAEAYPSVGAADLFFIRASARDSIVFRKSQEAVENPAIIIESLRDYRMALSLPDSFGDLKTQARNRIKMLKLLALNAGIDLGGDEYSSYDMDCSDFMEEDSESNADNPDDDPDESSKVDI